MRCVICRNGSTSQGEATVTLERGGAAVVFRRVPAEICDNCGEQFLDEMTSSRLFDEAEKIILSGAVVDVRDYRAA